MLIQIGHILQSHSASADDYFYDAIVCVAEHNAKGALGFVINRSFPRNLNELVEFSHFPSFPLYEGGPVDQSHLYFIHKRPDIIEGGALVYDGVYFGGNFQQAVQAVASNFISRNELLIFVGYCGWNSGELEEEIKENGWSLMHFDLFK